MLDNIVISKIGLIVVMYLSYIIAKNSDDLSLLTRKFIGICIVMGIFFDIGYIFKIKTFECEYNYLIVGITFVLAFMSGIKINMTKYNLAFFMLLAFLVVVVIYRDMFDFQYLSCAYADGLDWDASFYKGALNEISVSVSRMIFPIVRLIMLGIIIMSCSKVISTAEINKISSKIYNISKLYAIFIVAEIVLLNITGISVRTLLLNLFGFSNSTDMGGRRFWFFATPLGLGREPANFALSCFFIAVTLLYYYKINKKGKYLLLLYLFFILISGSLSGVMYLLAFGYLASFSLPVKRRHQIFLLSPIIVLIAAFVFFNSFEGRINLLLMELKMFQKGINYLTTNSTIIRIYSVYNNLQCFIKTPFLGTGIGAIYSFSVFATLLSNFGIIGTALFLYFYFGNMNKIVGKSHGVLRLLVLFLVIAFSATGHIGYFIYYPQTFWLTIMGALILKERKTAKNSSGET